MRLTSALVAAALAALTLSACSKTAGDNTTYARPPASSGLQIPIN